MEKSQQEANKVIWKGDGDHNHGSTQQKLSLLPIGFIALHSHFRGAPCFTKSTEGGCVVPTIYVLLFCQIN